MPYDPSNPYVQIIDGKTYVWQPDTSARETAAYLGQDAPDDSYGPGEGPGSWVPASYAHENGLSPLRIVATLAAAGAGGQALANFLPALFAGGAAGGGGAAAGATSLPAAVSGLPALPGTAIAGGLGGGAVTGAAIGGGAAAAGTLPAVTAGLPALPGTSVAGGIGAGTAAASGPSLLQRIGRALPSLIGDAGRVATAAEGGRAQGRIDEATQARLRDAANLGRFNAGITRDAEDISRRTFLSNNYQRQAGNAIRGDYLSGVQDASISAPSDIPVGSVSGGLRPSAFPHRGEIGDTLRRNAMIDLLDNGTGTGTTPGPSLARGFAPLPDVPDITPTPTANGTDTALNAIGYASAASPFITDLINMLTRGPARPISLPALTPTTPPPASRSFSTGNPMAGVRF